jgi:hypothetical protein
MTLPSVDDVQTTHTEWDSWQQKDGEAKWKEEGEEEEKTKHEQENIPDQ